MSPAALSPPLARLVAFCLDARAIWCIDGDGSKPLEVLLFADRATLERVRDCGSLHDPQLNVFVVTDGDGFESAWGASRLSGSLARWAWKQVSPQVAYFDESRWEDDAGGRVIRVRRKATLLWQARSQ
ncbi:MAG TPA: hypothetical protein VD965_03080 [Burkholderiales bacterium]|nr:hypothetical protein [Burkholderiales bacterium]